MQSTNPLSIVCNNEVTRFCQTMNIVYVYVIAWFAVVFGINSTSNAEIIVRGVAEYNLLHYECY